MISNNIHFIFRSLYDDFCMVVEPYPADLPLDKESDKSFMMLYHVSLLGESLLYKISLLFQPGYKENCQRLCVNLGHLKNKQISYIEVVGGKITVR